MTTRVSSLQVVPEKAIRESAQILMEEDSNNSFIYALESGKKFRENDLSPVYLLDNNTMTIYVTSAQHMQKKFH